MTAISYVPDLPAAKVHDSLRQSLNVLEQAQQCAVLWFAESMRRHLYREFDCASINQYAMKELGYTKAREIVGVATPETQDDWLAAAKRPRKELIREVKRVKKAAKVDPGQGELLPAPPTVVGTKELPDRNRTPAMRCRDLPTRKKEHDDHSTTRQKGSSGPRPVPLPGTRLQKNEVP